MGRRNGQGQELPGHQLLGHRKRRSQGAQRLQLSNQPRVHAGLVAGYSVLKARKIISELDRGANSGESFPSLEHELT